MCVGLSLVVPRDVAKAEIVRALPGLTLLSLAIMVLMWYLGIIRSYNETDVGSSRCLLVKSLKI